MKKSLNFLFVLFICVIFMPIVQAKSVNHFYAQAGDSVIFEDDINGSSAIAGESVESRGNVRGVNFLAGNKVEHTGQSDYLVLAGNLISVSGTIANDSIIAGNIIEIDKEASLKRDVIVLGSDITISGNLNRNVTVYGGKVSMEGASVNGNVRIFSEEIVIDDDSIIGGTLSYNEDAKATISSNITNVVKTKSTQRDVTVDFAEAFLDKVWSVLSLLFIFAILTLIIPNVFEKIDESYRELDFSKGVELFAKGVAFLMLVPLMSVFLLVIPFGIPLSLILLALYLIIIYLAKLFAAYLIGYKLWQKLFKSDINILLVGILGFALIFVLDFIPLVNSLVSLFTVLIGIGIIVGLLFDSSKA